jgi:cell division protein FtsN
MAAEQLQFFGQEDQGDPSKKRKIISIPLDTLMLSGVVLVLLLVLFFSLGVEKGKRNAFLAIEHNRDAVVKAQSEIPAAHREPLASVAPAVSPAVMPEAVRPAPLAAVPVMTPSPVSNAGKFSIQIASFQREAAANDEAKRLERKGLSVTVLKKGKFSVVCVGAYDAYTEAQKQLETLKRTYKDCFIRRL